MSSIFSDYNALNMGIKHKQKFGKTSNTWKLSNILLKNWWIKGKNKRNSPKNKSEDINYQNIRYFCIIFIAMWDVGVQGLNKYYNI